MGQVHAREARAMRPQAVEQEEEGEEFSLAAVKAKVVAVNVEGLTRTKDDVVMDSVKDLFKVDKHGVTL